MENGENTAVRSVRGRLWRRWQVFLIVWLIEAVGSYAMWFAWILIFDYRAIGLPTAPPLSGLLQRIRDLATEPGLWEFWGIVLGVATVLQVILLWPVRRPRDSGSAGWSLRASAAAAALAAAVLLFALVLSVFGLMQLLDVRAAGWLDRHTQTWHLFACLAVLWVFTTPLMWRFARGRLRAGDHPEEVLARVSSRLFLGTLFESVAVIPLDVMLRRKTDCYCGTGTFLALTLCGSVGVFAFGPAVLLLPLVRRRKRWRAGRCGACGYDMSGLISSKRQVDRCPECGAGWRPDKNA